MLSTEDSAHYKACYLLKIAPIIKHANPYVRNTPGSICQYKEDDLVSRPPSLFTSMRRPMHGTSCPKSQLKFICLTAKFGSFLDHAEPGGLLKYDLGRDVPLRLEK